MKTKQEPTEQEKRDDKEIIRVDCDCGHKGHFFALTKWGDTEMYAVVCEADRSLPFLHRLKWGFLYILGINHLNYTEVVLDREFTLKQLKDLIEKS